LFIVLCHHHGFLWNFMVLEDPLRAFNGPWRSFVNLSEPYNGASWVLVDLHCPLWSFTVLHGPAWTIMKFADLFSHSWSFDVICGLLWSYVILHDLLWSILALCGPSWTFMDLH
jgi:hypothetical protein